MILMPMTVTSNDKWRSNDIINIIDSIMKVIMMTDLNEELLLIENEMIWIGNDYMTMMILLLLLF